LASKFGEDGDRGQTDILIRPIFNKQTIFHTHLRLYDFPQLTPELTPTVLLAKTRAMKLCNNCCRMRAL
jgi:hypothetical protein